MTSAPTPFGVTALMSTSFRLLKDNFLVLVGVIFVAQMVLTLISEILLSLFNSTGLLVDLVAGPIIAAVTILMAADIVAGRPITLRSHISAATAKFGPLVVLSIGSWMLISLATLALVLPGLYVAAMMLALVPIIMIEPDPWRAMSRSYELSKPYGWPLTGLVCLLGLAALGLMMPLFLAGADFVVLLDQNILLAAAVAFLGAILSAFGSVISLLVYYRLTSGTDAQDLGDVFR